MKRIAMAVTILVSQTAGAGDIMEKAVSGVMQGSQAHFMDSICSAETSMSKTAQCYMTPSGKRVYQLPDGPDKIYWMKIGQEEHKHYLRAEIEKKQRWTEEANRRLEADKTISQHCKFWMDQSPSERRDEKIQSYCE